MRVPPAAAMGFAALVALNAWLVSVVVQEATVDRSVSLAKTFGESTFSLAADAPPAVKSVDSYQAILSAPVFVKTRHPYAPPPPAPAPVITTPPPPVDPGLKLAGVLIDRALKKAFLLSRTDSTGAWVGEGESFAGWKVESVEPAGVTLQNAGRVLELELYPQR